MAPKRGDEQRDRMRAALNRQPGPTSAAAAEPAPRPVAPRVKPVRVTVDLAPTLHRGLKVWAVEQGVPVADVLRVLASEMLADETLADRVRRALGQ